MSCQVAEARPVPQFPGACQRKDEAPVQSLDQPQIGPGGKARGGQYDHALAPGWGLEATRHLGKEDVLMSFALGIEHFTSDRQTQPPPLRHEQDYLLPEDLAGELVE